MVTGTSPIVRTKSTTKWGMAVMNFHMTSLGRANLSGSSSSKTTGCSPSKTG